MNILIISGGKSPSSELLKREIVNCDYIICADKGAECLYSNGITPNYLLGDFDSIDEKILNYYKGKKECTIVTFNKDKDYTDTKIAFKKAVDLGATYITFLGVTGTRIDHMLGNIGLLKKCNDLKIQGCIKDDNNEVYFLKKPLKISSNGFEYFSLQAYYDAVKCLSITGCKFELHNYDLNIGDGLTISNEFLSEDVNIDFTTGSLLLIYSRD